MSESELNVRLENPEFVTDRDSSRISSFCRSLKEISYNTISLIAISLVLVVFGFFFTYFFTMVSLSLNTFPSYIIFSFVLLETILLLFIMIFSTKNLQFTKFKIRLVVGSPLSALMLIFLLYSENNLVFLAQIPALILICSLIIMRVFKVSKRNRISFRYKLNFSKMYHNHKVFGLWVSLIVIFIIYSFVFFAEPQHLGFSAFLIIIFTLLFTQRDKELGHDSTYVSSIRDRHLRSATLVSLFLMLAPLIFVISSIGSINTPQFQFATVSQSSRIQNSNIDFSGLEYSNNLDNINPLRINDKFIIRNDASPGFGQAAIVRVRLTPEDVPYVEGYLVRPYYEITSGYLNGPLKNHALYTEVSLDNLDLLPGTYKIQISYDIRSGFSYRSSSPREYTLTIVKDDLRIISTVPYDFMPSEDYGSVYTVKNDDENFWMVYFNGQVVNSLNEPISVKGLDLYLELQNRYENLTTVDTNEDGTFFYSIQINGSFAVRSLARVEYAGDALYNALAFEEMAGFEKEINGHYFFTDTDGDGYPNWEFTLYDLLLALQGGSEQEYPPDLSFLARFEENGANGASTFDSQNGLEGILNGDTTWGAGKDGYGLNFDGTGQIIPGPISGFVKSVEYVEFSITGTTASASLTKSQDIANSIPFMTKKITGNQNDDYDDIMLDIYFGAGPQVTATRVASGGSLDVGIFVVEFDPTYVNVYQGVVDIPETFATDTDIITSVDLSKAAMIFYYKHGQADDDWTDMRVSGYFQDSSTVKFERNTESNFNSDGNVDGHYYVFEAKNNEFSVQFADFTLPYSQTQGTYSSLNAVDMSKSFVISSYMSEMDSDDDGRYGAVDVWLDSSTTLKAQRWSSRNSKYHIIKAFVVEFNGAGNENVYRGALSYAVNDGSETSDISSQVQLDRSIVHSPVSGGQIRASGRGNADTMRAWQKLEFVDSNTVQGTTSVGDGSESAYGHFEVIEWEIVTVGAPTYENFDYVDFGPDFSGIFGVNEFIITAWVNPTVLQSNQTPNGVSNTFIARANNSDTNFEVGITDDGLLQLYLETNQTSTTANYGFTGSLVAGVWSYIAIHYNASDVDVLIDDVFYRSAASGPVEPWVNSGSISILPNTNFTIGNTLNSYVGYNGKLDEVSIFTIKI